MRMQKNRISHKILAKLAAAPVPVTRKEIICDLQPSDARGGWCSSYFMREHGGSGWKSSLRVKGLIAVVGKRGNAFLYELTHSGRAALEELNARGVLSRGEGEQVFLWAPARVPIVV